MATPFLDDFTEASNTNLEDHTPSGGTAWTLGGGATGAALVQGTNNALRTRSTTASYYTCDDQGSANQYAQARLKALVTSFPNSYVACRLIDASNFVGWRCAGTGSSGLRLSENISGTVTDKVSFQGVDESVYRVEVDGTTAWIYEDGFDKSGGGVTVASSTETSQGVRIGSESTSDWIDDFEAGALGGSGHSVTVGNVTSTPSVSGAGVGQTHLIGTANATSQPVASGAVVQLTHQVAIANTTSQPAVSGAAVQLTHRVAAANATSQPAATGAAVTQDTTHLISVASATSQPAASGAAIQQTHLITMPGVAIDSIASGSAVVQAHLVGAASASSQPAASGASVTDGMVEVTVLAARGKYNNTQTEVRSNTSAATRNNTQTARRFAA